jgi:hypothetical protein
MKLKTDNLLVVVLLSTSQTLFAQISSPRTISFKRDFVPVSQPPIINAPPPVQVPKRMTAADVQRQVIQDMEKQHGNTKPVIPTGGYQSHQLIMQQNEQARQNKAQQQIEEIQKILREDLPPMTSLQDAKRLEQTKHYREAFSQLLQMQNGTVPFSLKKAVFMIENAYLDNSLKYVDYTKLIQIKVDALKMLMRKEKISATNDLGKNYLIQKLFSERIVEYKDTVVWRVHKPFQYDFEDFTGTKDWTKMFVSKLLKSGKGQCHSLPLLYLILAEEIKADAWLALAPEHSYIMFSDKNNTFYNYETTNGNAVTNDWLMESGFVNATAIKNRIYLDTLGRDGLMGTLLSDLIIGYTNKFGYDAFMGTMVDSLLSIHPLSIQGQIFKADLLMLKTDKSLKQAGNPPIEQLQQYPDAYANFAALMRQYDYIDNLGYMEMPQDAYQAWLASLESEKHSVQKQKLKTVIIGHVKASN